MTHGQQNVKKKLEAKSYDSPINFSI